MPFGDLFKLPEGFKRPRSARNRMEGLTFPQKINYMGQFEGPSLMALGAGIQSGHPEQGWADMAKVQAGYQGAYADEAEKERTRQQTMEYLLNHGISPADAEAAAQNPAIFQHLLSPPAKRNLIEVDGQIYDADTNQWISPAGGAAGAGGPFKTKSLDAEALNLLVVNGNLTPVQAAQVAAGKQVTGQDGSIYWIAPEGLIGASPGGQPKVVDPNALKLGGAGGNAGGVGTVAPTTPAPADASAAPVGGTQIVGPKETTEQKNIKSKAVQSQRAINEQLDHYVDLVKTYGIEARPGPAKDALNIARQGILLQLKELYNLGVLNGQDLNLMERMVYDPAVDIGKEGGLANLPGQLWTGATGGAANRAQNSVNELKIQLDSIVRSKTGEAKPGQPIAPAGNGGWTIRKK